MHQQQLSLMPTSDERRAWPSRSGQDKRPARSLLLAISIVRWRAQSIRHAGIVIATPFRELASGGGQRFSADGTVYASTTFLAMTVGVAAAAGLSPMWDRRIVRC